MKKLTSLLLALLLLLGTMALFASCQKPEEPHTHEFNTFWNRNPQEHWHDCKDDDCTEVSDKAAHEFGEGVITKAATPTADGERKFTCPVCGQTKTEPVPYSSSNSDGDIDDDLGDDLFDNL